MSRALQGGRVSDLADNADLAVLGQGMKLLAGQMGLDGMKQSALGFFGQKKKKDDFEDEQLEEDPGSEYDDDDSDYEGDYADGAMHRAAASDESEEDEVEDEGFMDDALHAMGAAPGAMLDRLGLRRKTFQADIHHVRLTNLARRRRDMMVIFTLGATANDDEGMLLGAAAQEAAGGEAAGGEAAAAEEEEGAEAAGGSSGATSKRGLSPSRRLRRGMHRRTSRGEAAGSGSTSKPVVFKTDLAVKPERGKTHHLKKRFHGRWAGKYRDLPHRVLHMALVEQTRFGNIVEIGTASLTLLELATGSVQQEVNFVERDGRTTVDACRMNFHIHFQERFTFVLKLVDWRGADLRATDDTGTSDPFLKFAIRGSSVKRYKAWYRRGGVFGRSTSTDVQINTLFPHFTQAKRPLYYHGTRSDLENETLHIEVYDWDATSSNDLIGFAEVPLRGVLLSGRVTTGLAMWASGHKPKSGENAKDRLITAGTLEGAIEMAAEPTHTQFGDVVKRLANMTYLALNVQTCYDLAGKKADGMSDPYVTAVWAATSQQTRVIRSTCAPVYDETLYFPTNLVRNTASELEAKGDLVLYVLHHSQGAPEDIGFAKIPLDRITAAPVMRIDDSGTNVKTRVYEATLRLQQQGLTRKDAGRGEVKVRAYFTPDLPADVLLKAREFAEGALDAATESREAAWRSEIPYRLQASGRYLCKALDETNTMRFLPTYLCKCSPPRDVADPMAIARMVKCIHFQQDAHLTRRNNGGGTGSGGDKGGAGGQELWSSPNYFLDVKKGASEDHAILQCNLFLGLGLDAYLAVGKLPGSVQQHVWVMTREPNGDVRFWETTKGHFYTLPGRWTGLYLDGAGGDALRTKEVSSAPQLRHKKSASGSALSLDAGGDSAEDRRKRRAALALALDKAEREAKRKAQELAEAQKQELTLLYLSAEEQWTADEVLNPFETPRDHIGSTAMPSGLPAPTGAAGEGGGGGGAAVAGNKSFLAKLVPAKASDRSMATVENTAAAAEGGAQAAEAEAAEAVERAGATKENEAARRDSMGVQDAKRKSSAGKHLPELDLPPLREQLPYETLEVIVNHENVWANLQGHSIPACGFDIEESDRWLPFIAKDVWEPPMPPRPFYSVGRIGPKLPMQRLSALRSQLHRAIKEAYAEWRGTRSLRTRWATSLEATLDAGLSTLEQASCSSQPTDQRAVDKWRGLLLQALPADYHFCGRAFSFSLAQTDKVVEWIMRMHPYHENGHKDVVFACAVQCFAHYGAVASTWVYLGWLAPHKTKKKKDKKEDD